METLLPEYTGYKVLLAAVIYNNISDLYDVTHSLVTQCFDTVGWALSLFLKISNYGILNCCFRDPCKKGQNFDAVVWVTGSIFGQ